MKLQYYDAETNWYYLESRYYNPEWCRFISPDMLSQHTKENGENLNSKIKELIAAIDGNIIEYYDSGNGGDGEVSDGKAYVKDTLWSVYLKTDTGKEYQLYISWVIANTANPNKVGMKTMGLCDMNHNSLVHLYIPND